MPGTPQETGPSNELLRRAGVAIRLAFHGEGVQDYLTRYVEELGADENLEMLMGAADRLSEEIAQALGRRHA
jgi:hypothetical protein